MAWFDDQWFSGLQTGLTAFFTAIGGAAATFLVVRKRLSSDNKDITSDRTESRLVVTLMSVAERSQKSAEESMALRAKDAESIGRLTAELESAREKAREQAEQMLIMKMRVEKLIAVVVKLDPLTAHRLSLDDDSKGEKP